MIRRLALGLVLLAGLSSAVARGEAVLTITDATIAPGGTAVVDVLIAGDGVATLDSFGIVVRVQPSAGRRLEFLPPGPGSATDGQLTDPGYLFFGDSVAELFPPAGTVVAEPNPNDTYVGGDGTLSGLGVLIPSTPTLLTRLELTAATSDAPPGGEVFEVVIDLADPRTFFLDAAFNPVAVRVADAGLVRVSVVPEPGSLTMAGMGLAAAGLAWSRRARGTRAA
jgi:hypothetical protein